MNIHSFFADETEVRGNIAAAAALFFRWENRGVVKEKS